MNGYRDILNKERPASTHPPMPLENRAKIFSPFAALRGFDIEILTKEHDKALEPRVGLCSDMQEQIEWELETLSPGDTVTIVKFQPHKRIGGQDMGRYVTERGRVVKVSPENKQLQLESGFVPFQDIRDIYRE